MSSLFVRKSWVAFVFFVCVSLILFAGISSAQEKYPSRNIELYIVMAPGGTIDALARIFADELSKLLNTFISPINKPGASGTVGAAFVAQAKKDGYTLLASSGSAMTLAPQMLTNVPFNTLHDFIPINIIGTSPNIIYVKNDSPFKSFEDLIDYARKNPDKLTYGTAGTGSDCHFFMEQLQLYANIKVSHVPFKGGGEVLPAVLGGHIDFGVSLMASVANQLKAGAARGLVISDDKRNPIFKDIPTTPEKGYPQQFINHWTALFTPLGVSQTALDVLVPAANRAIRTESFVKRVEGLGCSVKYFTVNDLRNFIAEEEKIAATVAKEIKKKPVK
jgi:tripartite-type tricarboxylate transporter receptor subunit TctC